MPHSSVSFVSRFRTQQAAQRFTELTERLAAIDELTAAIAEAAGAQPSAVESIVTSLGSAIKSEPVHFG